MKSKKLGSDLRDVEIERLKKELEYKINYINYLEKKLKIYNPSYSGTLAEWEREEEEANDNLLYDVKFGIERDTVMCADRIYLYGRNNKGEIRQIAHMFHSDSSSSTEMPLPVMMGIL